MTFFEANYLCPPSGAGDANYFEPLLNCIIIELSKLMEAYQSFEKEEL